MEQIAGLYIGIQAVTAIFSAVLWLSNRSQKAYLYLSILWFGNLINFGTQVASGQNQFLIAFTLATYAISSFSLVKLYAYITSKENIPFKLFFIVLGAGICLCLLAFSLDAHFIFMSLPVAVSVVFPLIYLSVKVILPDWKNTDSFQKIFGIIITLNSLHFLDFPFLRLNVDFAPVGFAIAFLFMFIFAIFLPAFISKLLEKQNTKYFEAEVQKRTKELYHAKEEKSQLLNILSHDLATPIFIIDVNLKALREQKEILGEKFKHIDKSIFSVNQIKSMLHEVRAMSVLEMGKVDIKRSPVSPEKIIEVCEELFLDRAKLKGIQLTSLNEIKTNSTFMANEVILVSNIISNFLTNAIKFTPTGGKVEIVFLEDIERQRITIKITDSGNGMRKEKIDDITMDKKQSELGTNGEKGTGLGLSVALFYIKRLKGKLEILSRPMEQNKNDHGTDIYISFDSIDSNKPC
jgi:signal transduction histidine kinase